MHTQETLLFAVQVHPVWAAIPTVPVPPVELKEFAAGEREKVQGGECADWFTVRTFPPMVRVPDLELPFGLAATQYHKVPFPLPLFPERIEIQPALLEEVQEQPLAAVTATLPVPPPALKDWLAGAIE
jgi:hypothetical protein